jgi:uncharacterized membrane protein YqjE
MTLYYQGSTARITNQVLEVQHPEYQSFSISELRSVHEVRNGASAARPVIICSVAVMSVTTLLSAVMWPAFGPLLTALAGLAVLLIAAAMAAVLWQFRRPSLELWGTYRGQPTCLYHTTDKLTFGQISRALRRVFEAQARTERQQVHQAPYRSPAQHGQQAQVGLGTTGPQR